MSIFQNMTKKNLIIIIAAITVMVAAIVTVIIVLINSNKAVPIEEFSTDWRLFSTAETGETVFYAKTTKTPTLFKNGEKLMEMHDDGIDGDETAGDGIYSAYVSISSSEECQDAYCAGFKEPTTAPIIIYINGEPSQEEADIFTTEIESIEKLDDSFEDANGCVDKDKTGEIFTSTSNYLDELVQAGKVAEYTVEDNCIIVIFTSGLTYVYTPKIEGVMANGDDLKLSISTLEPFQDDYITESGEKETSQIDENAAALDEEFGNITFDVNLDKEDITPSSALSNFEANKLVLWDGHGGYSSSLSSFIVTGETKYNTDSDSYDWGDWVNGRLIATANNYVAFTYKYIDKHCTDLSDSIFYFNCCHSAQDNILANSFINKGAQAFVGNTNTVYATYTHRIQEETMYQMTQADENKEYNTLGEALSIAKEKYGKYDSYCGAETIILGEGAEDIVFSNQIKKEMPTKIEFEKVFEDNQMKGIVNAYDAKGNLLWKYESNFYPAATLNPVAEIANKDNGYYLCEDGYVVVLNKLDGTVLWKSSEQIGGGIQHCFDDSGNIYVTSFFGKHAAKIDTNGKTIWSKSSYGDTLYRPYKIELSDGWLWITFEETNKKIQVNPDNGEMKKEDLNAVFSKCAGDYVFASGAGGWSTNMTLKSDGSFTVEYHDSDMGSSGTLDGKSYIATEYVSSGSGKFKVVEKIDDYSYKLELESYSSNNGEFDYVDYSQTSEGIRKVATETHGIVNNSVFKLYSPEAPSSSKSGFSQPILGSKSVWTIHPTNETLAFLKMS